MNRRLPRFAFLVVLLVSVLGVYQGSDALTKLVLANGESCDVYIGFHQTEDPPESDPEQERENFLVDTIFQSPGDPNSPDAQTLIQLGLLPDGEVSILPKGNAIIRVDDGGVTLWNCGNTDIDVLYSESTETMAVKPGEQAPIRPGEAIYVDADDIYYLSEGIQEAEGSPVAGTQQRDKKLSTDALPAANHGGSHLSAGIAQPYRLCSKGGC